MQGHPKGFRRSRIDPVRLEATSTAGVEHLFTATQVAQILGVRVKRVYELGIPEIRLSDRSVRYRPSALQHWIDEHEGVA